MSRARLLRSIAAKVGEYREGEIAPIDQEHVDRWVTQFDDAVQVPVLAELDHVLERSYLRRSHFEAFFRDTLTQRELVGDDACTFWAAARFFNQQLLGHSQAAMLELVEPVMQEQCGFSVYDCGDDSGRLVYVDDAVFTGIHVIKDLERIIGEAPQHTDLDMIVYAVHNQGARYATQQLTRQFGQAGKTVSLRWFCELDLENTTAADSDVLWPRVAPQHQETQDYLASLTYQFEYRRGNGVGRNGFFSSGDARHVLEQEFLKAGAVIRAENGHLNQYARPLGNRVMQSFGFGALIVTYRNCPNNCPLVFWAGDHPLFERDNN